MRSSCFLAANRKNERAETERCCFFLFTFFCPPKIYTAALSVEPGGVLPRLSPVVFFKKCTCAKESDPFFFSFPTLEVSEQQREKDGSYSLFSPSFAVSLSLVLARNKNEKLRKKQTEFCGFNCRLNFFQNL